MTGQFRRFEEPGGDYATYRDTYFGIDRSSVPSFTVNYRLEGDTMATKKHTRRNTKAKRTRQSRVKELEQRLAGMTAERDSVIGDYQSRLRKQAREHENALDAAALSAARGTLAQVTAQRDNLANQLANSTRVQLADALAEINRTFMRVIERV